MEDWKVKISKIQFSSIGQRMSRDPHIKRKKNFTSQVYWICSSGCQMFHFPIQSKTALCTDLMIYLHFSPLGFSIFQSVWLVIIRDQYKNRVDKQDKQLVTHSNPQLVYSEWAVAVGCVSCLSTISCTQASFLGKPTHLSQKSQCSICVGVICIYISQYLYLCWLNWQIQYLSIQPT